LASVATPGVPSPRWRLTLFRVLATLLGLVYLPGPLLMAAPWAPSSMATALPPLSPLIWAWAQAAHPAALPVAQSLSLGAPPTSR
jgi:hypothetical protein